MKRIGEALLWGAGIYFVARALVEPYTINFSDPASYQDDWGGPSLLGVLIIHCGLGVLAAALMAWRLMRRSSRRLQGTDNRPTPPPARGMPIWPTQPPRDETGNRPTQPPRDETGNRPTPPDDNAGRSLSMAGVGPSLPRQQERQPERQRLHQERHA